MDNYATHKTQTIRNWLAKRPRWHVHLTPTSASWINQVERFFAELTEKQIRRGVHRSTRQLEAAIKANIDTVNAQRSEEHTSELQSLMRNSYAVFCLKKKNKQHK